MDLLLLAGAIAGGALLVVGLIVVGLNWSVGEINDSIIHED